MRPELPWYQNSKRLYKKQTPLANHSDEYRYKNPQDRTHHGPVEMNPTRNHEVEGSIPGLAQWVQDLTLL